MHRQLLSSWRQTLVLCAALCGCSSAEAPGETAQAVIGGTETGQARGGVVYVTAEVGTLAGSPLVKIGSGVVVAPNLIATALHVISRHPSNVPFTCDANGEGSKGSMLGPSVPPAKISVYAGPTPGAEPLARGARIVSSESKTICQNDVAFVVLDRALELPVYRVRRGQPVQIGEAMLVVGFGGDESVPLITRTERDVTVTAVGQWLRTFTVSEGPCEGDSGGPALTPGGEVAGIFSSVSVGCQGPNASPKYTDLTYFSTLVERAFEEAGAASPWSESGSGGEAGQPALSPSQAGAEQGDAAVPLASSCSLTSRPVGGAWLGWLSALGLGVLAARVGRRRARCDMHELRKELRDSCTIH